MCIFIGDAIKGFIHLHMVIQVYACDLPFPQDEPIWWQRRQRRKIVVLELGTSASRPFLERSIVESIKKRGNRFINLMHTGEWEMVNASQNLPRNMTYRRFHRSFMLRCIALQPSIIGTHRILNTGVVSALTAMHMMIFRDGSGGKMTERSDSRPCLICMVYRVTFPATQRPPKN